MSAPGFESPPSQLSSEVLVTSILLFGDEDLAGLCIFPLMLSFYHPPAGPCWPKRHFEVKNPLPAIEHVLESSGPTALILSHGAGPAGRINRFQGHLWRSFDWCHLPLSCPKSVSSKVNKVLLRTRQYKDLSLDAFARGFGPTRCHRNDLQQRQEPSL